MINEYGGSRFSETIDQTLFFIAQLGKRKSSVNFFESLSRYLSDTYKMEHVFIVYIPEADEHLAETIAFLSNGTFFDNITYYLKNTPCENVHGKHMCCYDTGVQNQFPKDSILKDLMVESYIAVPLWDSENKPIGIIGMMGNNNIENRKTIEIALNIVSVRTAHELESLILTRNILKQNDQLRKVLKFQSSLLQITSTHELYKEISLQIKEICDLDQVQVANVMYIDNQYIPDQVQYINGEPCIDKIDFTDKMLCEIESFRHSKSQFIMLDKCIVLKPETAIDNENFIVIVTSENIGKMEIFKIQVNYILMTLNKIISDIRRENEQVRLFLSLGEIIEKRDVSVGDHVKRVSEATKLLASHYGLKNEDLLNIYIASSVHDIGKVYVPDSILNKPGKLTHEEFEIIKTHSTDKFKIIDGCNDKLSLCVHNVVRYHHENWDGTGYPKGLKGAAIPVEARIVSIIDVFEALTHERPYKKVWSYDDALLFIKNNRGKKFDPVMVDLFLNNSEAIYSIFNKYSTSNIYT